jgi:hypothetical protein
MMMMMIIIITIIIIMLLQEQLAVVMSFFVSSLFLETVSLLYGINTHISTYNAVLILDRQ